MPVLDEAEALPELLAELRGLGLLDRTLFVDNGSADGGPELDPRRRRGAAARAAPRLRLPVPDRRPRGRGRGRPRRRLHGGATAPTTRPRPGTSPGRCSPASPTSSIGSRRRAVRGAATGRMPLHQRLGNDWLALNLWVFFGLRLSDDGPFRAVRTDLLERLRLEERAYAFPTEMAVKARLAGARIAIRDTRYRQRAGASKIAGTWRGSALAVRDIFWCLLRLGLFGFRPGAAGRPRQ